MTQFAFGTGTVIAKRTDVIGTPPAFIGTLQDIEVDFDRTLKELLGQYSMPQAIGGGQLKVAGKAKFARIQATTFNNLFFGQTLTAASGLELTTGEAGTVPASTPYTVTALNSATWQEDFGVYYAATGVQLVPVASGPAAGQYSVAAGVYTFSSADAGKAVTLYYSYTVTTMNQIALSNQLMGPVPSFELIARESFVYFGATKDLVLKLNACVSSKLTMPFKNQDFMVSELDFTAYADASNNWGTLAITE